MGGVDRARQLRERQSDGEQGNGEVEHEMAEGQAIERRAV